MAVAGPFIHHNASLPLAEALSSSYVSSMSYRASRQKRKAVLASLPRFTVKDLIGLKLMDMDWNPIDPPWLNELPPSATLSDQVNEVRRRRAVLLNSMLDGGYEADEH